jgi:hypothetical protein
MDMNEYVLEVLARDRLAELRATSNRVCRARATMAPSRPVRVAVGEALIRLGRRLQGVRHVMSDERRRRPNAPRLVGCQHKRA